MSERTPEHKRGDRAGEGPPPRDRDQVKRELGRAAIDGKQRSDAQRAQRLGSVAVGRDRKSDPPREERSR